MIYVLRGGKEIKPLTSLSETASCRVFRVLNQDQNVRTNYDAFGLLTITFIGSEHTSTITVGEELTAKIQHTKTAINLGRIIAVGYSTEVGYLIITKVDEISSNKSDSSI